MAMADLFSVPTDFLLRDEIETLEGKPLQDKGEKKELITIEKANEFIALSCKQINIGNL